MTDERIEVEFTEEELAELMKDLPRAYPFAEHNELNDKK